LNQEKFFPFELIGNWLFPGNDFLFLVLDSIFFAGPLMFSLLYGCIFGFGVLPALLNKKFDDKYLESSRGRFGFNLKRPAFPAYWYYRARDYARAVVSEKKSQKIFNLPSVLFRSQVGRPTVVMCHLLIVSEWIFWSFLIYYGIFEIIKKLT
jgi:hypothetical protein